MLMPMVKADGNNGVGLMVTVTDDSVVEGSVPLDVDYTYYPYGIYVEGNEVHGMAHVMVKNNEEFQQYNETLHPGTPE